MRRRYLALSLAAVLLEVPAPTLAAGEVGMLTDYSIASWGAADGLPYGDIRALAQDHDGYLWLGTLSGLVLFDGVRFTTWAAIDSHPVPSRWIDALYVSRSGDLWVGFGQHGGIARLRSVPSRRSRSVEYYSEANGLAPGAITALIEDHRGTLWATGGGGLFWMADNRWYRWVGRGLPDGPIHTAHVDSRDRLLVSTWTGVFALSSARDRFELLEGTKREGRMLRRGDGPPDDWIGAISVDGRGRLWLADRLDGFKIVDGKIPSAAPAEGGRGRRLLQDRSGNVWVGTAGQGLWRIKQERLDRLLVDRATELNGLLGNGVMSLLEDRDGNIWAGTIEGLNRLTPRQATVLDGLGLVSGMEPQGSGIWVATSEGAVRVGATADAISRLPHKEPITAMHVDERSVLWLAAGPRLSTVVRGQSKPVLLDPVGLESIDFVVTDRRGGVWLYDQERRLLRWNGRKLEPPATSAVLPDRLLWMDTQRDGVLWLLGADGRVTTLTPDGDAKVYSAKDGLEADVYRAWCEDRRGTVWLGGARGLTRFAEGRYQTLRTINGYQLVNLTAIVEDETGLLWLGTGSGVVSIRPEDFDRALGPTNNRVPHRLYTSETLAGNPRFYGHRAGIRSGDGRLWFVTSRGVTVIDPRAAPATTTPRPVRIETVTVDGQTAEFIDGSRLAAGTRRLEVAFSALTLTNPERTHFRYRLDGFDANWVETGRRRLAAYTNLPAGPYRFQVMASAADGTWPDSGAVWTFSIAPMFYRTGWFLFLCVSLLGLVVVGAWRLHLRQVRMRFSLLLGERARLSREIHDTLLQGLFGVALRCDAIASEFETAAPRAREYFLAMRRDVEEYIREARQSIWNLRSPMLKERGIAAALQEAGQQATIGRAISFVFTLEGDPRPCARAVEEQLLRIGQEAVTNAVRHSGASEIRMVLRYEEAHLMLSVVDDGFGFDLDNSRRAGHYGLVNMEERAEAAGGRIRVESREGAGTKIETTVPYGRELVDAL